MTRPATMTQVAIDTAPELRVPRGALPRRELRQFAREACAALGLNGELSVLLTTDQAMQALNRAYRRKNQPTDVLSFPPVLQAMHTGAQSPGPQLAGDLAISIETAARQAAEHGHSLLVEVKILLLHGALHLSGLDHEQDQGEMQAREQELRTHFDLPAGLIERAGQPTGARAAGAR